MKKIKVIYRSSLIKELEIPLELFSNNVNSPESTQSKIFDDVINIEGKSGLIYYAIEQAKFVTAEGFMSRIILNGDEQSLKIMVDHCPIEEEESV